MKKLLTLLSVGVLSAVVLVGCTTPKADTVKEEAKDTGEVVENIANSGALDGVETNTYQEYSKEAFAKAFAEKKDVVLFFHADRCPSCKALDENINENLDVLTENLALFKVNYDEEKTLKDLYKVRKQHTLVFLDEQGAILESTNGIATAQQIVEKL